MNNKENQAAVNPVAIILIGVIFVSTSAPLVKLAETPAFILGFYRMAIAFLIMTPWALKSSFWSRISTKDLLLSCGAGFFLAAHFSSWFLSLEYTSVASSVVLVTLQPIFVVLGGMIFFREYLSHRALAGVGLALVGSFIIAWGDFQIGGLALLGDLLALMGAVFIAGYMLMGRQVRKAVDVIPYTWLVYGSASFFLALAALIAGQPFGPYSQEQWTIFILLAILPTLLGHSLFTWSLKWVKTALVSVAILGEPIGATILAYLLLGEVPTPQQVAGSAIILTGLLIFILYSSKTEEATNASVS